MNLTVRQELLAVLWELSTHEPSWRFGQTFANLALLARGPDVENLWEVEDDELLAAARRQLETLSARQLDRVVHVG